jgi:hypothetical protein
MSKEIKKHEMQFGEIMEPKAQLVVNPQELANEWKQMCEIRFDAIVKMFDYGSRETKGIIFGLGGKSLPPQLFKIEDKMTIDFIRNSDEYQIGRRIKQLAEILFKHIEDWEKRKQP